MKENLSPLALLERCIEQKAELAKKFSKEGGAVFFNGESAIELDADAKGKEKEKDGREETDIAYYFEKLLRNYFQRVEFRFNNKNYKIFQLWLDWLSRLSAEESRVLSREDNRAKVYWEEYNRLKSHAFANYWEFDKKECDGASLLNSYIIQPLGVGNRLEGEQYMLFLFIGRELACNPTTVAKIYSEGLDRVFDDLLDLDEIKTNGGSFRQYLVGKSYFASSSARELKGKSYGTSLIRMEKGRPRILALGGSALLFGARLKSNANILSAMDDKLAEDILAEKKQLERRFKQLRARLEYELLSTDLDHPLVAKIKQLFKLSHNIKALPETISPEYINDLIVIIKFLQRPDLNNQSIIEEISQKIDVYFTLIVLNRQDELYEVIADLTDKIGDASIVKKLQNIIFICFDRINKKIDIHSPVLQIIERLCNDLKNPKIVDSDEFSSYLNRQIQCLSNLFDLSGSVRSVDVDDTRRYVRHKVHEYFESADEKFSEDRVRAIVSLDERYFREIFTLGRQADDKHKLVSSLKINPQSIVAFFKRFQQWLQEIIFNSGELDILFLKNKDILKLLWKTSVKIFAGALEPNDAYRREQLEIFLKMIDFNQTQLTERRVNQLLCKYKKTPKDMEKIADNLLNKSSEEIKEFIRWFSEEEMQGLIEKFLKILPQKAPETFIRGDNLRYLNAIKCLTVILGEEQADEIILPKLESYGVYRNQFVSGLSFYSQIIEEKFIIPGGLAKECDSPIDQFVNFFKKSKSFLDSSQDSLMDKQNKILEESKKMKCGLIGYQFLLINKDDKIDIERGKIYLKIKKDLVEFRLIDLNGEQKVGEVELEKILNNLDIKEFNLKEFRKKLDTHSPQILAFICRKCDAAGSHLNIKNRDTFLLEAIERDLLYPTVSERQKCRLEDIPNMAEQSLTDLLLSSGNSQRSADDILSAMVRLIDKKSDFTVFFEESADFVTGFFSILIAKEFDKLLELPEKDFNLLNNVYTKLRAYIPKFEVDAGKKTLIYNIVVPALREKILAKGRISYSGHLNIEKMVERNSSTHNNPDLLIFEDIEKQSERRARQYIETYPEKNFLDHLGDEYAANRINNLQYVELIIKFFEDASSRYSRRDYFLNSLDSVCDKLRNAYKYSECSIEKYYTLMDKLVKLQADVQQRFELKPSRYQAPLSTSYVYDWIKVMVTANNTAWISASNSTTKLFANFSALFGNQNQDQKESRPAGIKEISTVLEKKGVDYREKLIDIEKIADKHLRDGARFRADMTRDFYQLILLLVKHPEMLEQVAVELTQGFVKKYSLSEHVKNNTVVTDAKGSVPAARLVRHQ